MAYNPQNPNGQATMANSSPVVVASDQSTLPITGTVTADTELPVAAPLTDATSSFTTPTVGAAGMVYNGVVWDRMRGTDALSGSAANDNIPGPLAVGIGPGFSLRFNPTNLGTAVNSASTLNVDGANSITVAISTSTTGTFTFEGTVDNTNWVAIEAFDGSQDIWVSGQNITPTAGRVYQLLAQGYRQVRLRTVTTLGATVSHFITVTNSQQFIAGVDTGAAPHNFGYALVHKDAVYATTQTSTSIWAPSTTARKFVITDITVTTGGTTAGVVTIYDATSGTAYSAGTTPAIFRGEFAPSTNSRPGVVKSFNIPYVSTTANNNVLVTTSAAINPLYIQINGYEI